MISYALFNYAALILSMPQTVGTFSTAKPYMLQLVTWLAIEAAKCLLEALVVGIGIGVVGSIRIRSWLPLYQKIGLGLIASCVWTASLVFIQTYVYSSTPWFAHYTYASAYAPWFVFMHHYIANYVRHIIQLLIIGYLASNASLVGRFFLLALITIVCTTTEAATIEQWLVALLISACTIAFLYWHILRHDPRILSWLVVMQAGLLLLKEALAQPFPGATLVSIATFGIICVIACIFTKGLDSLRD